MSAKERCFVLRHPKQSALLGDGLGINQLASGHLYSSTRTQNMGEQPRQRIYMSLLVSMLSLSQGDWNTVNDAMGYICAFFAHT